MAGVRLPSINRVMICGRLTADPEERVTANGNMLLRFRIASSRAFKDRSGEWRESVTYVNVVVWGELVDRLRGSLRKGSPVFIEGELRSRSWDTDTGRRSVVEIRALRVQSLERVEQSGSEIVSEDEFPGESPSEEASGGVAEDDLPFL